MLTLTIETDKLFTDITPWIASNTPDGFCGVAHVHTPHTTAGLAQLEDEILHHVDVRFFLDTLVPRSKPLEGQHHNAKYLHDMISLREGVGASERINGHSHIRSLFFPGSTSIPVQNGLPLLGEWKKVFFVELDPIRTREVYLTFVSEAQDSKE
jgi:secondary thiamine-phosphate synthase enzyme